jgi:hypothetical protein
MMPYRRNGHTRDATSGSLRIALGRPPTAVGDRKQGTGDGQKNTVQVSSTTSGNTHSPTLMIAQRAVAIMRA